MIQSSTILGYAARILATEAEHTGNLRLHASLYQAPLPRWTLRTSCLRHPDAVPVDEQHGPRRNPYSRRVLAILFGNNNASSGGFFRRRERTLTASST